jgi:hypothetical protein
MGESAPARLLRRAGRALGIEAHSWAHLARHGLPTWVIRYPGGIGDDLLCTAAAHELKRRNPAAAIWMLTDHPALLRGNADVARCLEFSRHFHIWYSPTLRSRRLELGYTREKSPAKRAEEDLSPREHIIAALCRQAGVTGEISLRPYCTLSPGERAAGSRGERQVAIQCIGPASGSAMRNKLWDPSRFQEVVDRLKARWGARLVIVQIGSAGDHRLNGVVDLRGKTSIRESAAVLTRSACFVGTVGFLMHLARAVECPAAIVYGGRERAWQSGYPCNENIESDVECAPCWRWNTCPSDRACMRMIGADRVERAVLNVLERPPGAPLEVERVVVAGGAPVPGAGS